MSEETIAYERYLVYTFLAGIHASVGVSLLSLSHSSLILSISLIRVLAQTIFYFNAVCLLKKLLSGIFYIFFNVNQFFSFDFFYPISFTLSLYLIKRGFGSFPLTILDIFRCA